MPNYKQQIVEVWQRLNKKQKVSIVGAAALVFIVMIGWSLWWGGRPDYTPLYSNLETKDASDIVNKLKEMKVAHEVGNNGTTILVPSKDVYKVRLDLAGQGLPKGSSVGFEIFDQNKWAVTEFQNKINLLQALQGELTRTIEQMSEVEKARVHIVMPEESLYKKSEKPATASIMLKLRRTGQLTREQVKGVVHLVSTSVQGLKPENITIVDTNGNILNDNTEGTYASGAGTVTQFEIQKKFQIELEKKAQTLLEQVLGPNKAAVRVNAELNFDQRAIERQQFEPIIDDKGIVRSSQEASENYKGGGNLPAAGTPGVNANIPGYPAQNNAQSNYEKKEKTVNYEINRVEEKTVVAPGSVKRISVAVIVDANLNNIQQESIVKTVSSAVGLSTARGDVISVESIPFSRELEDQRRQEELAYERKQQQEMWMKLGAGLVVVVLLLYLIRHFVRRKEEEEEELYREQIVIPVPETDAEPEMTPEEMERAKQREMVEKLARQKPEDIAQLLKTWLADE